MTDKKKTNALDPIADSLFDLGVMIVDSLLSIFTNPNSIDWEKEFKYLKLENMDEERPKLLECKNEKYFLKYYFSLPSGLTTDSFEKHLERFRTIFKVDAKDDALVYVERAGGGCVLVLDKDLFAKELFPYADINYKERGLKIPLGYYILNNSLRLLFVDLADSNTPHFSIAGTTGKGKSNGVKLILTSLVRYNTPEFFNMSICDLKGTECYNFEHLPHTVHYTDDAGRTCEIIDEILEMTKQRYKILKDAHCKDIQAYHKKGFKMPYHLLMIDEFPELSILADSKYCDEVPSDVISKITSLLNRGRAAGIIVGLSSQTNKATVMPTEIRSNIPLTIGLGARDKAHSEGICGMSGLENLRGVGMANIYGLTDRPYYTIKMFYMPETDNELLGLLPKKQSTHPVGDNVSVTVHENTKIVSGYDLDKKSLFAAFRGELPTKEQPKPKKERHRNKKKSSIADKLDSLD